MLLAGRLVGRTLAEMNNGLVASIVHLLVTGLSVLIVARVLPGMTAKTYGSAVFFALVVGVLNAIAWHFLAPFTITFTLLTLGIGGLVVNGLIFLTADKVVEGIEISGCFTAVLASIGVSFVNWVLHVLLGQWMH